MSSPLESNKLWPTLRLFMLLITEFTLSTRVNIEDLLLAFNWYAPCWSSSWSETNFKTRLKFLFKNFPRFLFWLDFYPYSVTRSSSYLVRRANRRSGPVTHLHGGFNLVQSRQKVQPHCRTEHRETPFRYLPVPGPSDLSLSGRRRLYRSHTHDARLFPPSGISLPRTGKSAHVLSLLVDSGSKKPGTFSRIQQSNCRFGGQVSHGWSPVS